MFNPWDHMVIIVYSPLVEVSPDMYDEYHSKDSNPASKGTNSSSVPFLVEDEVSDEDGTKDLRRPIDEIVQPPSTDGEDGAVVIVEFCVIHKRHRLASDKRNGR